MPELQHDKLSSSRAQVEGIAPVPQRACIQPHGLLLVLSEPDLVIRQLGQNCQAICGKSANLLLGRPIEALLGKQQRSVLEKAIGAPDTPISRRSLSFGLTVLGEKREFISFAHRLDAQLILELEPARPLQAGELSRLHSQASAALSIIEGEFDLERLGELSVKVLREIGRYERAVLYRFDEDGNRRIVAENRAPDTVLPPLLGTVLTASDAPIYSRRRPLREVRNLNGRSVPLIPALNPITGTTLSLEHASLGASAPSPWRQQLADQGVRGMLSMTLSAEGRLWGLLVAHHPRPRSLSREERRTFRDLTRALSRQIAIANQRSAERRLQELQAARARLLQDMAQRQGDIAAALKAFDPELLDAARAAGAALWWRQELTLFGRTPSMLRILALKGWLQKRRPYTLAGQAHLPVFATRSLQASHPQESECRNVAGLLAIPLGQHGCLMWFREAQAQTGDNSPGPLRCEAWTEADIASAQGFTHLGALASQAGQPASPGKQGLLDLVEQLAHGVIVCSSDGVPLAANAAAARVYDMPAGELLPMLAGANDRHLRADGSPLPDEETPLRQAARGVAVTDHPVGVRQANGSVRWTTVTCRVTEGPQAGIVMSLQDVSEQRRIERDLQTLAHFDALTDLPNRTLFKERIDLAVARLAEAGNAGARLGIIIVGLDRFKEINDTLGNAAGDLVLQDVARRLHLLLGKTHTVARFGGDEFAALVEGATRDEIAEVAAHCRDALDAPTQVDGHEIFISCSVGVSIHPEDGLSRDDLLRHADMAMNEAKAEGGNHLRIFSSELQGRTTQELSLAAKLRRALERGELSVAYQPQVDVRSNRIQCVEALMRWDHPELGSVPPTQFIRIAEETGLILPMGEWLLHRACEDLKAWRDSGLRPVNMAINLSARQFRDRQLVQKIASALSATAMDASWLEFEITEGVIMQDTRHNIETLEQLAALGARVAIDDFGTGYSSLAYLKRFPVHTLKIDRAFVRDISTDRDDAAIVRSIVGLAHSLELGVVAEGVETQAQLQFLVALNCDLYQGFYFSEPVPAGDIARLLEA